MGRGGSRTVTVEPGSRRAHIRGGRTTTRTRGTMSRMEDADHHFDHDDDPDHHTGRAPPSPRTPQNRNPKQKTHRRELKTSRKNVEDVPDENLSQRSVVLSFLPFFGVCELCAGGVGLKRGRVAGGGSGWVGRVELVSIRDQDKVE